jgi:hypothetical protein
MQVVAGQGNTSAIFELELPGEDLVPRQDALLPRRPPGAERGSGGGGRSCGRSWCVVRGSGPHLEVRLWMLSCL